MRVGASPRGALALLKLSKAMAFIDNRMFVTPDDVKALVPEVLAHRILLDFECAMEGVNAKDVIIDILNSVEVPKDFS